MLNVPSHEDQRNVDVVRIPSAVAGTLRYIVLIMGRLQNNLHASAALTLMARNFNCSGMLSVEVFSMSKA